MKRKKLNPIIRRRREDFVYQNDKVTITLHALARYMQRYNYKDVIVAKKKLLEFLHDSTLIALFPNGMEKRLVSQKNMILVCANKKNGDQNEKVVVTVLMGRAAQINSFGMEDLLKDLREDLQEEVDDE